MKSFEIDPKQLVPNPWNSNKVGPENMEKLKRSIKDLGFASAVVVRERADGKYEILGGKHRAEAAIELKLKTVPVVNLGPIDDVKARKIGLVDNQRYGNDDVLQLARIYEEIGASAEDLVAFLPVAHADIEAVLNAVDINLDDFDVSMSEDEDEPDDGDVPRERPTKTHDVLKFRVSMANAEAIRQLVEATIKAENFSDNDEMSNAGDALAFMLLNND
jgi:ParB-like chromosome segregation protein Spo0J